MLKPGSGRALAWIREHVTHQGEECLIYPFSKFATGYGQVGYYGKVARAHRLMCELVHGPAPAEKMEAAHSCGNGHLACVNPKHLSWKTRSQNQKDRYVKERIPKKGLPRFKLNAEKAAQIRQLRGIETQQSLAERFGVSIPTIVMVQKGQSWKFV